MSHDPEAAVIHTFVDFVQLFPLERSWQTTALGPNPKHAFTCFCT